jgi:hypothetical protein
MFKSAANMIGVRFRYLSPQRIRVQAAIPLAKYLNTKLGYHDSHDTWLFHTAYAAFPERRALLATLSRNGKPLEEQERGKTQSNYLDFQGHTSNTPAPTIKR